MFDERQGIAKTEKKTRNEIFDALLSLGILETDWFSRKAVYIPDTFIYNLFDNRVDKSVE